MFAGSKKSCTFALANEKHSVRKFKVRSSRG